MLLTINLVPILYHKIKKCILGMIATLKGFCYIIPYGISDYGSALVADHSLYYTRRRNPPSTNRSGCWWCVWWWGRFDSVYTSWNGESTFLLLYRCFNFVRPLGVRNNSFARIIQTSNQESADL